MKKVDNYAFPEVVYFQNNDMLKFWALRFFLKYGEGYRKIVKYFYKKLILDQFNLKSHTGNDTTVSFRY